MACDIPLENSQWRFKLCFKPHPIRGLHAKLWRPKIVKVLTLVILGLPLGSPGTKSHLNVGPVEKCRVYYKGESGGFPQVRAVVSLVCPCCPWFILAPKVLQLCTKHLALVLCRSVWVDKACQLFLVPSRSSNTPLYPSKMLQTRERAPIPYFFVVFCLGLTFESLKEVGVHQQAHSITNFPLPVHQSHWLKMRIKLLTLRGRLSLKPITSPPKNIYITTFRS